MQLKDNVSKIEKSETYRVSCFFWKDALLITLTKLKVAVTNKNVHMLNTSSYQ